jgi:cell division control protein 45
MDMDLKRHLRDKLDSIAPEYGLVELSYPSFTRAYGFQVSVLSAADAVEGLSALLEAAKGIKLEIDVEGGRGGGEWFGGSRTWNVGRGGAERELIEEHLGEDVERNEAGRIGNGADGTQAEKKEHNWCAANFWVAYDACDE